MPLDSILLLVGIQLAMSWTPGPNNALLSASGAKFGLLKTLPHMLGVALGFAVMLFVISMGLGEVFLRSNLLRESLRWVGAALMLYFAWLIATAKPSNQAGARKRPFRFIEAAAFQWINPKAWVMAISLVSQFTTVGNSLIEAMILSITALLCGLTSVTGWTLFGVWMQQWLSTKWRHRLFNLSMAAIIASGSIAILTTQF